MVVGQSGKGRERGRGRGYGQDGGKVGVGGGVQKWVMPLQSGGVFRCGG